MLYRKSINDRFIMNADMIDTLSFILYSAILSSSLSLFKKICEIALNGKLIIIAQFVLYYSLHN